MATTIQIYGTVPGGGGNVQDEKDVTISTNTETAITPDEGYDGIAKVNVTTNVQPTLQTKSVTPGTSDQTISADDGYYGLSSVSVPGDTDLVAENIKKDVDIFGVTGTLEAHDFSDYSKVGTEIDVEAETSIAKGGSIIGRLNDQYVAPSRSETDLGIGTISNMSEDGSVLLYYANGYDTSTNSIGEGSSFTFYFRDDETGYYGNPYQVILENYPSSLKAKSCPIMNEDGTLAVCSNGVTWDSTNRVYKDNYIIVFEIDKVNHTVAYYYKTVPRAIVSSYPYTSSYSTYFILNAVGLIYCSKDGTGNSAGLNGHGILIGSKLITDVYGTLWKTTDDSFVGNTTAGGGFAVLEYVNHEFVFRDFQHIMSHTEYINKPNYSSVDGLLFFNNGNGYLAKYDLINKTYVDSGTSWGSEPTKSQSSKNCKYWFKATRNSAAKWTVVKYELNFNDLTFTELQTYIFDNIADINSVSPGANTFSCNYDGNIIYTGCGYILDLDNNVSYGTSNSSYTQNSVLARFNDKIITRQGKLITLTPGSQAQYLIRQYTPSTAHQAGDVLYGVASQDLAVGTRGTARMLNKMQDKTVSVTNNGTTSVSPDSGYDSLNEVEVNVNIEYNATVKTSGLTLSGYQYTIGKEILIDVPVIDLTGKTDITSIFNGYTNLKTFKGFTNCDSVTNAKMIFNNCSSLESVTLFDTSSVQNFLQAFMSCTSLKDVPQFNFESVTVLDNMFYGCRQLTDNSLNNILASLNTMENYSGEKTLLKVGFLQDMATRCTTLSNWQTLADAGWTTGY